MSADDTTGAPEAMADADDRRAHNWRAYLDSLPADRRDAVPEYGQDVCGLWPPAAAVALSDQSSPGADFSPCLAKPRHTTPYHVGLRFREFDRPVAITWRDSP